MFFIFPLICYLKVFLGYMHIRMLLAQMRHVGAQQFAIHQEVNTHVERTIDSGSMGAKLGRYYVLAANIREEFGAPVGMFFENSVFQKIHLMISCC